MGRARAAGVGPGRPPGMQGAGQEGAAGTGLLASVCSSPGHAPMPGRWLRRLWGGGKANERRQEALTLGALGGGYRDRQQRQEELQEPHVGLAAPAGAWGRPCARARLGACALARFYGRVTSCRACDRSAASFQGPHRSIGGQRVGRGRRGHRQEQAGALNCERTPPESTTRAGKRSRRSDALGRGRLVLRPPATRHSSVTPFVPCRRPTFASARLAASNYTVP